MSVNWEPLRDIIDQHQRFLISSHVRPDADALGSELALAAILEDQDKSVRIVNPSATPSHLEFLDPMGKVNKIGRDFTVDQILDTEVHIVVDTSAWVQLVDVGKALRQSSAKRVVIDHHMSSDDLEAVEFKDTSAEATGAMIFRMAEALGYRVPPSMAVPLFCAIATDTGWFRFSSTSSDTMRIISRLIDLGAEPHLIYQQLYEQNSIGKVRLAARVLSRVQLECGGRLAWIQVKQDDFEATESTPVDTEDLVNETLKIAGTQAAFIAIEQLNKTIKFSLRSQRDLNVAALAEPFGGGGHKQAAGAVLPGPLDEAVSTMRSAFLKAMECDS